MAKKNLKKIIKNVENTVGFGAVEKYGYKLNEKEIKAIADYAEAFGGNREYVASILINRGRPFSISDATFRTKCLLCHQLNNYCCC